MNARKILLFCLLFIIIFIIGIYTGYQIGRGKDSDLQVRTDAVNRDIEAARSGEREAKERAEKLQGELSRITEDARILEQRNRELAERTGKVETDLKRALERIKSLTRGIDNASASATESGNLIDELGKLLLGIQDRGGKKD
jgi:chromosome segregation ATPase